MAAFGTFRTADALQAFSTTKYTSVQKSTVSERKNSIFNSRQSPYAYASQN